MTREADASRKPTLLAQILEYLLDKPLATLSFRTLAKALDVSTFTLVYHFGSRAQLLSDIVWAISARERDIQGNLSERGTIDSYFEGWERAWEWAIQPRNRKLQRLEFEAAMMEVLDPSSHTFTRELFAHWQSLGRKALISLGLGEADAELESRLTVDSIFGIQYDLVINQDVDRATAAFRHMLAAHRSRVEALIS